MIREAWHRLATAPPAAVAAGLALVHLIAAGFAFDPTPHTGGDNAAYLALARSLLESGRYLELWDPAAAPHTQYPPGFPALLAGAMALGITSWTALKVLVLLTSAVAVALSYRWMRDRPGTGPGVALGAALIVALATGVIDASHWILSDVPFWAATMGALWFAARDRVPAAAGLAFGALLIRTAGLPVVVAVAVWLALRRRWAWAAAVLGLLALLGVAWTIRASGSEVPYASDFWLASPYAPDRGTIGVGGLLERVALNARAYAFGFLMDVVAGAHGLAADLIAGAVLAFAGAGWALRLRAPGLPEILLPLYLGMVLVWPTEWADGRLLLPVLPVILLLAAEGTAAVALRPGGRRRAARALPAALRGGGLLALILVLAPALYGQWRVGARCRRAADEFPSRCLHPSVRPFLTLAAWTAGQLPEGAAALSRKPTLFYHWAGVPGRPYPFTTRPGALLEEAERAGARYVVVDRLGAASTTYLLPAIAADAHRFCIVQAADVEGHETVLLGILPTEVAVPEGLMGEARTERDGDITLDFPVCPAGFLREDTGP